MTDYDRLSDYAVDGKVTATGNIEATGKIAGAQGETEGQAVVLDSDLKVPYAFMPVGTIANTITAGDDNRIIIAIKYYSTMPAAASLASGTVVLYTGATTETYDRYHFYQTDGTDWTDVSTSSWGSVTGTISDQTDLVNLLAKYIPLVGTAALTGSIIPTDDSAVDLGSTEKAFRFIYTDACASDAIKALNSSNIEVNNALVPNTTAVLDIGSSALLWRTGYFSAVVVGELTLGGTATNSITTGAPEENSTDLITSGAVYAVKTDLQSNIDGKVSKNADIAANPEDLVFASYDAKGLVTGIIQTNYNRSINIDGTGYTVVSNAATALPTVFAPTTVGTAGQLIVSNGAGAPTWEDKDTVPTADSTRVLTSGGAKIAFDAKQPNLTAGANISITNNVISAEIVDLPGGIEQTFWLSTSSTLSISKPTSDVSADIVLVGTDATQIDLTYAAELESTFDTSTSVYCAVRFTGLTAGIGYAWRPILKVTIGETDTTIAEIVLADAISFIPTGTTYSVHVLMPLAIAASLVVPVSSVFTLSVRLVKQSGTDTVTIHLATDVASGAYVYVQRSGGFLSAAKVFDTEGGIDKTQALINAERRADIAAITPVMLTDAAVSWAADSTYSDYSYKGTVIAAGCAASGITAVVEYSPTDSVSGDYSPFCIEADGAVYIWSTLNTLTTIEKVTLIKNGS